MPGKGPFSDTQQIVSAFSSVHDDQEFIRLYEEYLDSFGTLHQRAWDYFDRFLSGIGDSGQGRGAILH